MTIHKLTAGDGYTYLTRQIAGGDVSMERGQDAASYFTAKGNPPGRWMGRGAPVLGLEGHRVTEEQMRALFGQGMHPDADRLIREYLAARLKAGMTDKQRKAVRAAAIRHATLGARFPEYKTIDDFEERVERRSKGIEKEIGRELTATDVKRLRAEEARRARAATAGFDVVFAPVKSAALLWALDPRGDVRKAVRAAHEAARDAAMELLEQHAALTRTGKGGVAQIETNGLTAAVFDHYDSRGGDPNLHTHVAISSKVQGVDGKWRSLDARALYRITVAVSEFYNTRFETELTSRLPVRFTAREDTRNAREPIREIDGIPLAWIKHFSSRRAEIEDRWADLLRQYRREHGHDPTLSVAHQLARQANLDTREGKKAARSLEEMRAEWTESFTRAFGARAIDKLFRIVDTAELTSFTERVHGMVNRVIGVFGTTRAEAEATTVEAEPAPTVIDIPAFADLIIERVMMTRSTWTVWNLRAEAERSTRQMIGFSTAEEHQKVVEEIVEVALSPERAIRVDHPSAVEEPASLRRSDGTTVFEQHRAPRYTSRLILDAEQRLVTAARTQTAVGLAGAHVAAALDGFDAHLAEQGMRLDPGQRQLVTLFAVDSRLLTVGLGPAGAGKTTAMRAYAHVAAMGGQRILPLATSAAAAHVLGAELGMRADNLHKMITEYTTGRYAQELNAGQRVPVWARTYELHPGDVVLVDEAGMAGTLLLDQLVQITARRGAVVRLLGDYRQLGAVESGGALRLISQETGVVELSTLYRFKNPVEAEATLKVRVGDSSGLDFYFDERRVRAGSVDAMTEAAYAGWKADMLAGRTTLMAAATTASVTELSAQARRDRVEAGQVKAHGVALHDGNLAGVGDWIVTRHNERALRVGRGDWVKNGDGWTVTRRHRDGSLTVRHLTHRATLTLPAAYVAAHVELLYATTTNRAQGSTVDTAHPLITAEMSRENFYVITSRARLRTNLYVATHIAVPFDPDDRLDRVKYDAQQYVAREVLENILGREGNELSASETLNQAADDALSLSTLVPRHQYGSNLIETEVYTDLTRRTLPRPIAAALIDCESWGQAVAALTAAEASGWSAEILLKTVGRDSDLLQADTPGRLLAWRINEYTDNHVPLAPPTRDDVHRYLSMLSTLPGVSTLDPGSATRPPAVLRGARDRSVSVSSNELTAYAQSVATALSLPADLVTTHRAWPHLAAALTAAQQSGLDVPGVVGPLSAQITKTRGSADTDRVTALSRAIRHLLKADPATTAITMPRQLKHTITAAAALGHDTAEHLRALPSWAALDAALHRAERSGHHPLTMLTRVAEAREYTSATDPNLVLAWRLNRYLSTQPSPSAPTTTTDWRMLAWTLKAVENTGVDLHRLLTNAQPRTLTEVMDTVHDRTPTPQNGSLPWLARPAERRATHELSPYLDALETPINSRVANLTAAALETRPAWFTPLGIAPDHPDDRAAWMTYVGRVAAYRDQAKVTTDDPKQVLGPYTNEQHHRTAYEHAVEAVFEARRLAGLESEGPLTPDDRARAQVAVDLYLSQHPDERARIQNTLIERRELWFGDRVGLDDHAVIRPENNHDLQHVLAERGHFTLSSPATPTAVPRPVEVDTAKLQRQRQAERAARIERARVNTLRTKKKTQQQQPRRIQIQRRSQELQTPRVQPSQPTQRQERELGH